MAYSDKVVDHYENPRNVGTLDKASTEVGTGLVGAPECGDVMRLQIKVNPETQVIEDAKFKTFGCGSAIASSSLATEWVKGKTVEDALKISNTDIVKELSLPPVKIHCSVLAEDAIRAAIGDWKKKNHVGEELSPLKQQLRPTKLRTTNGRRVSAAPPAFACLKIVMSTLLQPGTSAPKPGASAETAKNPLAGMTLLTAEGLSAPREDRRRNHEERPEAHPHRAWPRKASRPMPAVCGSVSRAAAARA